MNHLLGSKQKPVFVNSSLFFVRPRAIQTSPFLADANGVPCVSKSAAAIGNNEWCG
jgi:hypothetical protein